MYEKSLYLIFRDCVVILFQSINSGFRGPLQNAQTAPKTDDPKSSWRLGCGGGPVVIEQHWVRLFYISLQNYSTIFTSSINALIFFLFAEIVFVFAATFFVDNLTLTLHKLSFLIVILSSIIHILRINKITLRKVLWTQTSQVANNARLVTNLL